MPPPTTPTPLRILLVEDNVSLAERLCQYLAQHRVTSTIAHDLPTARDLITTMPFDAVVLDLTLGDDDGLTLAREIVARDGPPIVIASARGDEVERVIGLESGADDYLAKPYSFRELLVRVRLVVRRWTQPRQHGPRIATFGRWRVDLVERSVTHAGERVDLTPGDFALLEAFLKEPNRVLTRADLMAMSMRDDEKVFDRAIDVTVARLRARLEETPSRPTLIQTVRGAGYRFSAAVQWVSEFD